MARSPVLLHLVHLVAQNFTCIVSRLVHPVHLVAQTGTGIVSRMGEPGHGGFVVAWTPLGRRRRFPGLLSSTCAFLERDLHILRD